MGEDGMLKESTVRLTDSSRFDKEERDRYAKMMLGGLVPLFTVSLLFIAVRVYTRKHILKKVKMDDCKSLISRDSDKLLIPQTCYQYHGSYQSL